MSAPAVTMTGRAPPRPTAKRLLPFRAEAGSCRGFPVTTLFFSGKAEYPDRTIRSVVFQQAGDTPIGEAILQMMKMYFELESCVDGLVRDREELQETVGTLQARLESETYKKRGAEAQHRGKKEASG